MTCDLYNGIVNLYTWMTNLYRLYTYYCKPSAIPTRQQNMPSALLYCIMSVKWHEGPPWAAAKVCLAMLLACYSPRISVNSLAFAAYIQSNPGSIGMS